jgi:DNA-binding transcriptional LysR family regulator
LTVCTLDIQRNIVDVWSLMETNRLRQLCVVVETGGLRDAARLLHISHSGLSKSIKALEQELDAALFLPSGRGIVPTDVGRQVYTLAKRILTNVDELERIARGDTLTKRPVRIGTFEVFSTYFMGEIVEKALAGHQVFVREAIPGAIEEALVNDEVDLGLTYLPVPRVELEFLRVATMEMEIYGRFDRFGTTPTSELPFCAPAIPVTGAALVSRSLDGWPDDTCTRNVMYAVDMMETALDLARRGLGVVYIPTFIAKLHNRKVNAKYTLERLPLPKAMANPKDRRRHVCIVKRRSTEEADVMKRVAKVVRDVVGRSA